MITEVSHRHVCHNQGRRPVSRAFLKASHFAYSHELTVKRTIGVFLDDASRRIGTLRFDSQGARQSAAFEYDRQWLAA
jgi:hypothetical protein